MRNTVTIAAAGIAACLFFVTACTSAKHQSSHAMDKYLSKTKEKWKKAAVQAALAQMPARTPRMHAPGREYPKASLVLFYGWGEDSLVNFLYVKNMVDCSKLEGDQRFDAAALRTLISHDTSVTGRLPDLTKADLENKILQDAKDVFWIKGLRGSDSLVKMICEGRISRLALHGYIATSGDTTIPAKAAQGMSRERAESLGLDVFLPKDDGSKSKAKSAAKKHQHGKKRKNKAVKKTKTKK